MLIFFLGVILFANPIDIVPDRLVILDERTTSKNIGLHLAFREDRNGQLSISDVERADAIAQFQKSNTQILTFPPNSSYYWIKFDVLSNTTKKFILLIDEAKFREADLYSRGRDGKWEVIRNGFNVEKAQKLIVHNFQVYPLELKPNTPTTFFLRIKPQAVSLPLYIKSEKHFFHAQDSPYKLMFGLIMGVILFTSLNNLAVYFSTRNTLRLLYFFTALLFVVYSVLFNGYVIFASDVIYRNLLQFILPLSLASQLTVVMYSFRFLQIKNISRILYFWSILFIVILGVLFLVSLFVPEEHHHKLVLLVNLTGILVLVTCLTMGLTSWVKNDSAYKVTALIYSCSYILFFLAFVLEVGHLYFGWEYVLVVRFLDVGFLCEAVGLGLALNKHLDIDRAILEGMKNEVQAENLFLVREQNHILEERVYYRTFELEEKSKIAQELTDQLKIQSDHLHELNKIKDRLFSIISHDLRSPLTQLTEVLNLADNKHLTDAELKPLLTKINSNVGYTLDLTNNLLFWAKSQISGFQPNQASVRLFELVRRKTLFFKNSAQKKKLQLYNDIQPDLEIFTDENIIALVVHNLLSNAIKFCKDGDVITIGNQEVDGKIIIDISDTGVGIDPENIQNIFANNFFTTQGTSKEKGSGLGLMICRDLLKQIGGELRVESQLGLGSTFYLSLPRVEVAVDAQR